LESFNEIKTETGITNPFFVGFIFQNAFSMDKNGFQAIFNLIFVQMFNEKTLSESDLLEG